MKNYGSWFLLLVLGMVTSKNPATTHLVLKLLGRGI